MEAGTIQLAAGAFFVAVHAAGRFNTPATSRSLTTAARYHSAKMIYLALFLAIYLFLVKAPYMIQWAVPDFGDSVKDIAVPLYAALAVTVFLPLVPGLSHVDKHIRKRLQRIAAIPHEARRLSNFLQKCYWTVPQQERPELTTQLAGTGLRVEDLAFDPPEEGLPACKYRLTRLSALMHHLDRWEKDEGFKTFMSEASGGEDKLKNRFDSLKLRAQQVFGCAKPLVNAEDGGAYASTLSQLVSTLKERCDDLLSDACDRVARGILQCKVTRGARRNQLEKMGFVLPPDEGNGVDVHQLVALLFMLMAILLTAFVVIHPAAADGEGTAAITPIEDKLLLVPMIALIYCTAVLCAVWVKDTWRFAQRRRADRRPIGFYVLGGLFAVVTAMAISLFFHCMMLDWDMQQACPKWLANTPFQLLTFITAFMTGYLIDNRPQRISRQRLQLLEGAVQGAVTMGISLLVYRLLQESVPRVEGEIPPLAGLLVVSGLIGFVLGFFVPTWYRESPPETQLASIGSREEYVDRRPALEGQAPTVPG